jgi:predicted esterase
MVDEDEVAKSVVCGPDASRHLEAIEAFATAGFDRVYVHQVGPDQLGFMDFYEQEIMPTAASIQPQGRRATRAA